LEKDDANHAFDVQSGNYVNMVKAGIIDPTKVVRLALQGAALEALLITTEAMVAEKPETAAPASAAAWVVAAWISNRPMHWTLERPRFSLKKDKRSCSGSP
jgi:hypothetical protein